MPLRHVIKNGRLQLDAKSIPTRIKRTVIASAKPTFGGVELEDIKFAAFPLSLAYLIVFGVLFILMLYYQISATVGQHFLMYPQKGANGKDPVGLVCESVPRNQSQIIYGTYDGWWSTERNYNEKNSIFSVDFNAGAQGATDMVLFQEAMASFKKSLASYGQRATSRPIIWSLLILCSITLHHPLSNVRLTLSVDASYIFNNVISSMAISSSKGVCVGRAPLPTFTPGSPANLYLHVTYEASRSSLQMTMPFSVTRASVYGNASNPGYLITSTPRVQETCPHHGSWVKNIFNPADPEFRKGEGSVDFDVRGLMLAMALNLNLVSTDAMLLRSSSSLEIVGLVSVVDPWYTFPPMQRIYCIDKASPVWRDQFSEEEQRDQMNVLDNVHPSSIYAFPNICFVVSNRKTKALQLFYPILSQLKSARLSCTDTPNGCPTGSKSKPKPPFSMSTCACPQDANNTDCNRLSIFTGLIYDTNIANSNFLRNTTWSKAKLLIKDKAVNLGISMQKQIVAWRNDAQTAGKEDSSDQMFLDFFAEIFEATMSVVKNVDAAAKNGANAQLAKAWGKIADDGGGLAAIIFRSLGIEGSSNFILPINKFNVQLSDLILDQAPDRPVASQLQPDGPLASQLQQWQAPPGRYFEMAMNATFKGCMCQNLFSFSSNLDKLAERSPLPLTETFLKCVRKNEVSVMIALGSAWSTTNLLGGLLWAIGGWIAIHTLKQCRLMTGSRSAVVSRHTKQDLAELFQDMKDEALLHVLTSVRDRDRVGSADDDEQWANFRRLYCRQRGQSSSTYADDELLGAELSRRANALAKDKYAQLLEMLQVPGVREGWNMSTRGPLRMSSLRDQAIDQRIMLRSHPLASTPGGFEASNPLAPRASVSVRASRRFSFNAKGRRDSRRDSVAGEGLPVEEEQL